MMVRKKERKTVIIETKVVTWCTKFMVGVNVRTCYRLHAICARRREIERERERKRERDRQTEIDRERKRQRQTDRQRQKDRQRK